MIRAACYITAGYTECHAMTSFFHKINQDIVYFQRCPNRPKRKKNGTKEQNNDILAAYNGLTGKALIDYVKTDISQHYIELKRQYDYDIIIIEDDLDFRFHGLNEEEIINKINEYKQEIADAFHGTMSIPICIVFASPEIEAWFWADWNNSFEMEYKRIFGFETGGLFTNRLHKNIQNNVLREFSDHIEDYYVQSKDGVHQRKKISNEFINEFDKTYREICNDENISEKDRNMLLDKSTFAHYSKRENGENMLYRLDPFKVSRICRKYFAEAMNELGDIR